MDTRQAFEHWFSDEGKTPSAIDRNADGQYILQQAWMSWSAWQAAVKAERDSLKSRMTAFADGLDAEGESSREVRAFVCVIAL